MPPAWPSARRPTAASAEARLQLLMSVAAGQVDAATMGLTDDDERVRATALTALAGAGPLDAAFASDALDDPSPLVRRALAEVAAHQQDVAIDALLVDHDDTVVESACWAAGERFDPTIIGRLVTIVDGHSDALCREAAVAAIGAIGDRSGLDAILRATGDKATVRRRAVLALAPFDDPRVDEALQRALQDRDWQVRQAAEDLIG